MHVSTASLPASAKVVFFSQRWLKHDHPDNDDNIKHKSVVAKSDNSRLDDSKFAIRIRDSDSRFAIRIRDSRLGGVAHKGSQVN